MKLALILIGSLSVSGCAVGTAASVGVWAATGKTATDHAIGWTINRDCNSTRLLDRELPCQEHLQVYNRNPF
jgi:hypothetical protein